MLLSSYFKIVSDGGNTKKVQFSFNLKGKKHQQLKQQNLNNVIGQYLAFLKTSIVLGKNNIIHLP